ncbi:SH2 domain-containing protein B-like [Humulus lupulus]|uniref:SH2 domain-containing protein B-like n=1 Tax=Humulus lupulus TaxID=3486 RepID=UPI002B409A7A|nr:SH2 domain-containing protein B-like [Humulus lupulus]
MGDEAMERENYLALKDLRVEIEREDGNFSLCFWIYLTNSTTFPVTLLQKVPLDGSSHSPLLVINEKEVMLFPLLTLHNEVQNSSSPAFSSEVPRASVEIEFPLEKWVHFGCEVLIDCIRLHIDGECVGDKSLSSIFEKESSVNGSGKITLVSAGGDEANEQGYIYNIEVLSTTSSTKDHFAKDPPVQLSIDKSSASEIEEGQGGIWSIVGGKASCRRNFSLDVVFLDTSDQPVSKEMEVVASLLYLDNGEPVERTSDGEAPLLASFDGIEFASYDKPIKLLHGRASFKLKISQLSSKCQNRLFRIRFHLPNMKTYPFFEAFSPPIRSISRNQNTRVSSTMWKRSNSAPHQISQSPGVDEDMMDVDQNSSHETKPSPLSKRLRLGQDRISTTVRADPTLETLDDECNSHSRTTNNKVEDVFMTDSTVGPGNFDDEDNSSSESESIEARNSAPKSTSSTRNPVSDTTIFKYCLAGLTEKSLLLKEIAHSASNKELLDFANQVSLYSGCSHHRNQIIMAKQLVEEGTKVWNSISQNNNRVQWESVAFEIEEHFMKIACCSSRSLTQQDFDLLKKIAGCQEYVAQENFEQMWCWLYPVAYTLSRDWINTMWSSTSPRWIEGFITKEEAELSLQGPKSFQEPGTFILRFPTSRSWPHPDAGSLVVTYIGSDYTLRHKLLSLDHLYSSCASEDKDVKPLQDILLEEPELSRLGRIIRSH